MENDEEVKKDMEIPAESGKEIETSKVEDTKKEEVKTFTRDEVNKIVSAETNKAIEKYKAQVEVEKTEAEKLAQMTETQKLQYQLKKQEEANLAIQKKLNARDLKDEAIKIATTQDTAFDPEFLNLFEFENMTAEQLQEKTKLIKSIQDRIVEKTINEWSKEKPPYNPNVDNNSNTDARVSQAFGN